MKRISLLKTYLKGSKKGMVFAFALATISTISKLMIPYLAGRMINEIIQNGFALERLSLYLYLMIAFLTLGVFTRYGFDALCGSLAQKIGAKIRKEVVDAYLSVPISYVDKHTNGDLLLRLLNDTENVQNGLVVGGAAFFDGVVAIIVTTVMMFTLNWLLGIAVVLLTPLSLLASRFVSRFNAKHFKGQAKNAGSVSAFFAESLSSSETIQNFNLQTKKKEELEGISDQYRKNVFKASLGASLINPSTRLVNGIINAILITLGALIIAGNWNLGVHFGIGDLTAFLVYASNYMDPFNEVSDVVAEMSFAFASLERIDSLLREPRDQRGGKNLPEEVEKIEGRNISFGYDDSHLVIRDVSLSLPKGKRIALVGPTGCGKTTLIQLLMGFYPLKEGDFYWDSKPSSLLSKDEISRKVGMVLQNTWIFHGTVKENIAYGNDSASDEDIIEAAKAAKAHEMILRLPKGYDTVIDDGSGLSAGEKQLLCVARVFCRKPEIIVLDEATSNIDIRTESLLNGSFDRLMKGKTSLVVAHRLSTIVSSDCIYCLKDGKIVESGTHDELLKKQGFYYSLYMSQFAHEND